MSATTAEASRPETGFRHEALFYAGDAELVARAAPFIREGLERDEPVLVVVAATKIDRLRAELGDDARRVEFADVGRLGRNPGRIIAAWDDFVAQHADERRPLRGIGEPIWVGRSAAELVECHTHEALLNRFFAGTRPFWLMCPYDVSTLGCSVVDEARRTHPFVYDGRRHRANPTYRDDTGRRFDQPLPDPAGPATELSFDGESLRAVRAFVSGRALAFGLPHERVEELVLAVDEAASNSVVHAGGHGTVRAWAEDDDLVFEVWDAGCITHPFVGCLRPGPEHESGYGLWLANQLCDLVQIRSGTGGTTVRLHASRNV